MENSQTNPERQLFGVPTLWNDPDPIRDEYDNFVIQPYRRTQADSGPVIEACLNGEKPEFWGIYGVTNMLDMECIADCQTLEQAETLKDICREKLELAKGWECTDPNCHQYRRQVIEDRTYFFKEDRLINPETKETEVFEKLMDYELYTYDQLMDACLTFGYSSEEIDKWITEGEEIPLMLECLFELAY